MAWLDEQRDERPDKRAPDHQVHNRRVFTRLGIMAAVALFMASAMPPALVAPALSSLLCLFAVASGMVAGLTSERLFADHLTRWDQGAFLLALSILAGLFVDPEALRVAVEQAG